jgi:hypothetical protein
MSLRPPGQQPLSSWIRDHALDPLGLATHEGE